jgi:hypothetical protein
VDDEVELDPDADDAEELELDLELPHAVTAAVIKNKQAASAASLLQRMASLILGLSSSCSRFGGAALSQKRVVNRGSAARMLTRLSTILWCL